MSQPSFPDLVLVYMTRAFQHQSATMRGRSAKKETTAPKYRQLLATSVCVLGEYIFYLVRKQVNEWSRVAW